MTLQEFITKWNGKYLEVAGSPGATNQCVDLANGYIRDVLGLPIIEWTNAVDFPTKAGDAYDYILNTPTNIPQEGDIVVWGPTPGHIAVFIEGNVDTFRSFDQNYPIGSPCHVQSHTYITTALKVTGWLRKKVTTVINCDDIRIERDRNWSWFVRVCDALHVGANVDTAVAEATKLLTVEQAVLDKDKQLLEAQTQVSDLKIKLQDLTVSHNALQSSYNALQQDFTEDKAKIEDLTEKLQELEKQITTPVYSGWKKALIELVKKLPF